MNESNVGQTVYSLRSISIEPLIEHIKSVFRIDPLPVRQRICQGLCISTTISTALSDTCLL